MAEREDSCCEYWRFGLHFSVSNSRRWLLRYPSFGISMTNNSLKTILIVEDHDPAIQTISRQLSGFGYTPISVSTGQGAIDKITEGTPIDLILMDLMLGAGLDGTETAKRILAKRNIPIVFTSSLTDQEVVEKLRGITRYGFVNKNSGDVVLQSTIEMAFELFEAHQIMRESEEKYSAAFLTSPDAININSMDGIFIDVNDGFTRLTGYHREEVLGTSSLHGHIWAIPEDRDKLIRGLRERGKVENLESTFRCKDGLFKICLMSAQIITIKNKPHILSVTRDITDRKLVEDAVRHSEEELKSLLINMQVGVLLQGPGSEILLSNPKALELLGLTEDQLLGKTSFDPDWNVIHEDGSPFPGSTHPVPQAIASRQPVHNVIMGVFRPLIGDRVWLLVDAEPQCNADNTVKQVVCTFIDINDRKAAERNLQDIITKNPMSIQILDKDGFTLEVNDSFISLFGSVPPTGYSIFTDNQFAEQGLAAIFTKLRSGDIVRFPDVRFNPHDSLPDLPDMPVWTRTIGFPLNGSTNKPEKFVLMHENITDRKLAEDLIYESEDQYRGVVENSPTAIAIYVDGIIVFVNNQCVQLMGAQSKEELIGKSVIQFVHPDNRAMVIDRMKQVAIEGTKLPVAEEKFIRIDGSTVYVEVRAIPTSYKHKPAVQLIVLDITERKNSEQALRQAQKLESIGTLAGGIAHDFNNLMNAVLGQSALALQKLPKESPAANNIRNSIKAGERVADLTKQLLAYSGRGRFVIDEIDLNQLVIENVAMLEVSIPKTTQLRYELCSPSPHIMGDISQIQQVIMNLIINAGEAMGSKPGYISVHTNNIEIKQESNEYAKYFASPIAAGKYAMLQVRDTGSGISEESLDRIFDPFFTTKFAGRGLGLAAVLGIIKGHKGGLRIESEIGKGSMFEIVWPIVEAKKISLVAEKKEGLVGGEGKTILIIDDESTIIELVTEVLSDAEFKVLSATDPIKGIELYRQHHPTIAMVVLDYSMPHMDGMAAFEELKSINKGVKVLLCSGYSEEDTLMNFKIDRPIGFLQKPYKPKAMVECVMEIADLP